MTEDDSEPMTREEIMVERKRAMTSTRFRFTQAMSARYGGITEQWDAAYDVMDAIFGWEIEGGDPVPSSVMTEILDTKYARSIKTKF